MAVLNARQITKTFQSLIGKLKTSGRLYGAPAAH
jgi:hypothetical protein